MRDLLVFGIVMMSLPMCFRRPFIGLLVFSWLAYMRPQDLCWTFARNMRFSFYVGITMIAGWFVHESQVRPFWRADLRTVLMLVLLIVTTISLVLAREHNAFVMRHYFEFFKIIVVALFTTGQVNTKNRLRTLLWTISFCLAFYGIKGGLFGVLTGGSPILRGPGGMLEDNNDFALALVMNIPLLFYLGRSEKIWWLKQLTNVAVFLTLVTVLLTHSRGAFVAAVSTLLLMAWRARHLMRAIFVLGLSTAAFFLFAPAHVIARIATIGQGAAESSAGARITAWQVAMRMIEANPFFGVGIRNFRYHWEEHAGGLTFPGGFAFVAHNSYLQIWAENGTIGFIPYLILLGSVFWVCRQARKLSASRPDMDWVWYYSRLFEATTVAFMVGAVFLNRGHFDLIYHWLSMVSCMALIVRVQYVRGPAPELDKPRGLGFRWRPASAGPSMLPRWGR